MGEHSGHELCRAALADLNEELDAMLYAISHEVRAPLRSIDGFSLALEEDCGGGLDGMCLDYLQRIRKATAKTEELIAGVLRVSRQTRGEMSLQPVDMTRPPGQPCSGHTAGEFSFVGVAYFGAVGSLVGNDRHMALGLIDQGQIALLRAGYFDDPFQGEFIFVLERIIIHHAKLQQRIEAQFVTVQQ